MLNGRQLNTYFKVLFLICTGLILKTMTETQHKNRRKLFLSYTLMELLTILETLKVKFTVELHFLLELSIQIIFTIYSVLVW